MDAVDVIGGVLLVVGSLFILLAAVGVVRFTDIYARMHSSAKAPTLGVLLVGAGVIASVRSIEATLTVLLVVVLQAIAGPVGSHVLARAVYYRLRPPVDDVDELAIANDRETDPEST